MRNIDVTIARKQGFRRLWAVLSVLWLIGVGIAISDWANDKTSTFVLVGLLPPFAAYGLGVAVAWIIEGFSKAD